MPLPSPLVVLLIDDTPFTGAVLKRYLASEPDIELHCCLTAADAFAAIDRLRPVVILQDLVMPDVDGFEMLRRLRAHPPTARTPVYMLSGNDDAESRARSIAAGADGYLVKVPPKPVLVAEIRAAAELALQRGHAAQAADPRPDVGE